MNPLADALGLYVHWPYCARICPYCDFNVYRPKGQEDALLEAILADMSHWRARSGARPLASLHFGGGTPSLMTGAQIERLIAHAETLWGLAPGAEIGLEANPKDVDHFGDFIAAGVNRLSIGVQSLDDVALKQLGRDHDGPLARRAIERAMAVCDRVSIDMIYARAGQSAKSWEAELREILAFGAGHISPYQLTIEARTAFGRRAARGEQLDSPEELAADLYELTHEICEAHGLAAYEISNHARTPADQSHHNRLYWEGGDWIGVGPGAHGRIGSSGETGRQACEARAQPKAYLDAIAATGCGVGEAETLSAADERAERILMGMRLADGLDLDVLQRKTGLGIDAAAFERLSAQGLVEQSGGRIRLLPAGLIFADRISGELVPDLS
ncbi:radical SAM family heme chaperone HemW [Maricaulis salignorans]|uniref:Heme chaperone HemW n=1 Tax=Maricaulis salignorans TaxID=144026 RepID=A0A1G9R8W8_9PROT|nr:radical SAM family heme chaperone HemW [Maricaulis salignorans]SDM19673.1 coproporphyrinogen III oxidase, anaerobic [Maricaulis salignorans]